MKHHDLAKNKQGMCDMGDQLFSNVPSEIESLNNGFKFFSPKLKECLLSHFCTVDEFVLSEHFFLL
jgi:hypothetical protein